MDKFLGNLQEVPADSLAYVGDAVFELAVRRHVLGDGHWKSGALHGRSIAFSKASAQAEFARRLCAQNLLTEQEQSILLRGRNAQPGTMAKHADPADYRWATGLECLLGYLYLKGEKRRLDEIFALLFTETLRCEALP